MKTILLIIRTIGICIGCCIGGLLAVAALYSIFGGDFYVFGLRIVSAGEIIREPPQLIKALGLFLGAVLIAIAAGSIGGAIIGISIKRGGIKQ